MCGQVAKEEGIECKFARTDGYLFPLTEDKEHVETLDKEMAAARRAGLVDVRKVRMPFSLPGMDNLLLFFFLRIWARLPRKTSIFF